jgi:alkylation response protein AidB-like acyl-CoA dehydrogenase
VQGPQVDPYPLPTARLRSSLFFGGTVGSENLSTILALRATEEQKRKSWEMAVRIEKILCTVLNEAHEQQVEEVMKTLAERPEGFYRTSY